MTWLWHIPLVYDLAVRSDGWQIHEGLDIRCLQRDKHGEPTDPVMATADGTSIMIPNGT